MRDSITPERHGAQEESGGTNSDTMDVDSPPEDAASDALSTESSISDGSMSESRENEGGDSDNLIEDTDSDGGASDLEDVDIPLEDNVYIEEDLTGDDDEAWLLRVFEEAMRELEGENERVLDSHDPLSDKSRDNIRGFKILMTGGVTKKAFTQMRHTLADKVKMDSEYVILQEMARLTGVKVRYIDCCTNSCVAYTRHLKHEQECPECSQPRCHPSGKPRRRFAYIPLIPQLQALFKDEATATKMKYRAQFNSSAPDLITDVFDGKLYQQLLKTHVTVDGQDQKHMYFSDPRDIALSSCTDGFLLYNRNRKGPSATPILLQNLNLPPTIRTHIENLICVGVIPGPSQPKQLDTFLAPLDDDLAELADGVDTYDVLTETLFPLHAYQIFNTGDIVAIERALGIKGHNSFRPCRNCTLSGFRNLAGKGKIYYIPLQAPMDATRVPPGSTTNRDPNHLPLRKHRTFITTLTRLDTLKPGGHDYEVVAKQTGIKRWPAFRRVDSLDYSRSFPWDWMHLLLENIIPNLIDLWMGRYKGLDEGNEDYEIVPAVWKVIAEETVNATAGIPGEFVWVLKDLLTERSQWTAESYCFWFCYLMPVLLKERFPGSSKYYKHALLLVKIMRRSLQFQITGDELTELQADIVKWVERYEKYYYQGKESRLSASVLTVHGLLHLVDDIKNCGPSWTTWTFFMERYCGILKHARRSKAYPWANLNNICLRSCYYRLLKLRFSVERELEDAVPDYRRLPSDCLSRGERMYAGYSRHIVAAPHRVNSILTAAQRNIIAEYIQAVVGARGPGAIKKALPTYAHLWGKLRIERSARIRATWSLTERTVARDASYVRYELVYEDGNRLVKNIGYGEVIAFLAIDVPNTRTPFKELAGRTLLLALVRSCNTEGKDAQHELVSYSKYRQPIAMDVQSITNVVGSIKKGEKSYIIDRFDDCAEANFDPRMDPDFEDEDDSDVENDDVGSE